MSLASQVSLGSPQFADIIVPVAVLGIGHVFRRCLSAAGLATMSMMIRARVLRCWGHLEMPKDSNNDGVVCCVYGCGGMWLEERLQQQISGVANEIPG